MSSKKPVSRFRTVVDLPKKVRRDLLLSTLSFVFTFVCQCRLFAIQGLRKKVGTLMQDCSTRHILS